MFADDVIFTYNMRTGGSNNLVGTLPYEDMELQKNCKQKIFKHMYLFVFLNLLRSFYFNLYLRLND